MRLYIKSATHDIFAHSPAVGKVELVEVVEVEVVEVVVVVAVVDFGVQTRYRTLSHSQLFGEVA